MSDHEYQQCEQLIQLFDQLFYPHYQTRLIRGGDEPLYLPASKTGSDHQVIFARGFFTSALHEIAHWCVAGPERRLLEDFGYWYLPDGRTEQQQRAFELVEVQPQAYEQCFTLASGRKFNISADNLSGQPGDTSDFELKVHQRTLELLWGDQLQGRARVFFDGICQSWDQPFSAWQQSARQTLEARIQWLESGRMEACLAL